MRLVEKLMVITKKIFKKSQISSSGYVRKLPNIHVIPQKAKLVYSYYLVLLVSTFCPPPRKTKVTTLVFVLKFKKKVL